MKIKKIVANKFFLNPPIWIFKLIFFLSHNFVNIYTIAILFVIVLKKIGIMILNHLWLIFSFECDIWILFFLFFYRGLFHYTRHGKVFIRGIYTVVFETVGTDQSVALLGNTSTSWREEQLTMDGILSTTFNKYMCVCLCLFHECMINPDFSLKFLILMQL